MTTKQPRDLMALANVWPYAKLGLLLLAALLALLLVFQNREVTHVVFLRWEGDLSLSLVVMLTLITGVAFGLAISWWSRRRARPSKPSHHEVVNNKTPELRTGHRKGRVLR